MKMSRKQQPVQVEYSASKLCKREPSLKPLDNTIKMSTLDAAPIQTHYQDIFNCLTEDGKQRTEKETMNEEQRLDSSLEL